MEGVISSCGHDTVSTDGKLNERVLLLASRVWTKRDVGCEISWNGESFDDLTGTSVVKSELPLGPDTQ